MTCASTAARVENSVFSDVPNCRHSARIASGLRSSTVTSAPMPTAIIAACVPTTPPPRITTLPGATPGTPPSRMPLPPFGFSRKCAPACTDMRPATSDIGASSGSPPVAAVTVS